MKIKHVALAAALSLSMLSGQAFAENAGYTTISVKDVKLVSEAKNAKKPMLFASESKASSYLARIDCEHCSVMKLEKKNKWVISVGGSDGDEDTGSTDDFESSAKKM